MFKFLLFVGVIFTVISLPYTEQIALANSLEVGRPTDPNTWDCADCYPQNKPINYRRIHSPVHDIHSIVSIYPEFTVLAFRYTATILNVWQDLLWTFQIQDQHACKGCKVQRQYDRMWGAIRSEVFQAIRNTGSEKLVITGISLGGGLSCISYVDISHENIFKQIEIITYGAPRVGNKEWAAWFDQTTRSKRIYIFEDPVAILPRCLFPHYNYRQTGTPIVCYPITQTCDVRVGDSQEYTLFDSSKILIEAALTYDHNNEVGSVYDHIFGYKKIYNYTQTFDW